MYCVKCTWWNITVLRILPATKSITYKTLSIFLENIFHELYWDYWSLFMRYILVGRVEEEVEVSFFIP